MEVTCLQTTRWPQLAPSAKEIRVDVVGGGYLAYNDIHYTLILEFRRDFDSVSNGSSNLRRIKHLLNEIKNSINLRYPSHQMLWVFHLRGWGCHLGIWKSFCPMALTFGYTLAQPLFWHVNIWTGECILDAPWAKPICKISKRLQE